MRDSQLWADFVAYAKAKLEQNLRQVRRCAGLLSQEELWGRANRHANSIGNLLLHLNGNVRQWIVAGIGGQPFERDRPAEFAARGPRPADGALEDLEQTVAAALRIIAGVPSEQAEVSRCIQGYEVSTLTAVFHVVEHFSFHTGQIVHATKLIKNVDLSLYDEQGRKYADPEEKRPGASPSP
jgi:uncharacterized damage-inducible protein DinB